MTKCFRRSWWSACCQSAGCRSSSCRVWFPHDESVIPAGCCLLLCFPLTHPSNLWEGGRRGLCWCHNTGLLSAAHVLKRLGKTPCSFCPPVHLCPFTCLRFRFLSVIIPSPCFSHWDFFTVANMRV